MAKGKNQRLRFKRRRNAETDYHRRSRMLRSGIPVSYTHLTLPTILLV